MRNYTCHQLNLQAKTASQETQELYERWKRLPRAQQRRVTASIFGGLQTTLAVSDPVKANDVVYVIREAIQRAENQKGIR